VGFVHSVIANVVKQSILYRGKPLEQGNLGIKKPAFTEVKTGF
jgi:hypothetical protein